MSGILVVAHEGLGPALCAVAETILGQSPRVTLIDVAVDADTQELRKRIEDELRRWPAGDPPLVLTDLPGATPHNVAEAAAAGARAPVLTGLNLPMLLRALNHRECPARDLAELAAAGGRSAIFTGGGA